MEKKKTLKSEQKINNKNNSKDNNKDNFIKNNLSNNNNNNNNNINRQDSLICKKTIKKFMKIKSKSKSKSKSMNKIKSRSFQNNDQQQQQQLFSSLTYENQLILNKSSSLTTLKTSKSTETIIDEYLRRKQIEPLEIIGEGGFSTVYKVRYLNQNNNNDHIYAAKVMNLNETNRIWVTKCLKHEMFISKLLQHPNIVRTYDYFKTNTYAVIIMEYYSNGSIRLEMDRQNHPYDTGEAGRLFTGLITGLQYMHSKNIAHRDLKLDNFFLDNNRQPLIGDFGFAAIGIKQGRLIIEHLIRQTRCGSDGYMAPEIAKITKIYSNDDSDVEQQQKQQQQQQFQYNAKKADVYSMGVCLYEMLHQKLPNINMTTTDSNTSSSSLTSLSFATNINERWQNLIKSMLNLEPNERPTVEMISYQISTPLFRIMTMVQSTIIKKKSDTNINNDNNQNNNNNNKTSNQQQQPKQQQQKSNQQQVKQQPKPKKQQKHSMDKKRAI